MRTSFTPAAVPALLGLGYACLIATAVAGGIWTWLMRSHPASKVAPFSMLVPVVGLTTAWLALGERPHPLEVLGGVVVVAGVLYGSSGRVEPKASRPSPAETQPV